MKILKLAVILVLTLMVNGEKRSFEGYKLYKVIPKSQNDVEILSHMKQVGIVDIWNEYFKVNDDVRVMVSPEMQPVFLGKLLEARIQIEKTIIENVQRAIDDQMTPATRARSTRFLNFDWESYHDLQSIETWMEAVVAEYPNIVSPVVMGTSVENREIKGIVINYNPSRAKPTAMLEGTLHAREWISPATITWIVKELLTSTDEDVRYMAENLEWHVFPVVNPDGYEYTFTTHRMWRKNRSRTNFTSCAASESDDDMSNGVDLNRNFDFYWNTAGASQDPCTNTFSGPSAASEPETQAISQYVLNLKERGDIIYYLSFHSYTQVFIIPYSHVETIEELAADNHNDMVEIATNSATRLSERHGTPYRVGIAAEVLYPMSGSSFDWVKMYGDAAVSYLIELRDTGEYGFLLPTSQIVPNNEEIMDAMIEMDRTTRRLGYYSSSHTIVGSLSLLLLGIVYVNIFN